MTKNALADGLSADGPIPSKVCAKCGITKPEDVFRKNGRGRRGSTCNSCHNERRRTMGESARRRASETSEERSTRLLWETYKLTREQHAALVDAQRGVCAICGKAPKSGKRLAVDHCHATGKVRALLCTYCNVIVGAYENYGRAAAEYLAVYGAGNPLLQQ